MPVTPRGYLYGPPLSASVEGQAAYEGALGGLANLGPMIMQAQQLGPAGDAAYLARTVGGQKLGEAAGKLTGGLTYGGGDALRQIFAGLPAGGAGGKGGRGALQMALDPQPIHVVQDEASRLHGLAVAFQDAERRRALDMTPLGRAVAPQAATEGLRNVPAERLGLDPRTVVRPDTISQLADLVGRKDPSARSMLIAEGLSPDMTAEDLAGLAAKSRLYQSQLASRMGRKQKERAAIDLSGRTLLMKSRLTQMGYDADNIDTVAAELAKLGDDAARFALAEMGRPTKFGHELALAKRRAHRVTTVINKYVGLPQKGTSGGAGGGRSASEIGKELKRVSEQRAAIENKVEPGVGYTTDQQKTLDDLRIRQKTLELEWDSVYLGESRGPAGKALTAGEEAQALWASGADYDQAFTRMKSAHPNANIPGILLSYGKRDAWNKERAVTGAATGAVGDFSVWLRGLNPDARQKADADLDTAARAVIASGGTEDEFVSSAQQGAPVFSLPHGESYLRMAFVAAKNSPAGSTPSKAVAPEPVPGTTTTTTTTAVPVDVPVPTEPPAPADSGPVRGSKNEYWDDFVRAGTSPADLADLDSYKSFRKEESGRIGTDPASWHSLSPPREMPILYREPSDPELFFDMISERVRREAGGERLKGTRRTRIQDVISEAEAIADALEAANSSADRRNLLYFGEEGKEARNFLLAAIFAVAEREGMRKSWSEEEWMGFGSLMDPDPSDRWAAERSSIVDQISGTKYYIDQRWLARGPEDPPITWRDQLRADRENSKR
jgi:hypothetical protein